MTIVDDPQEQSHPAGGADVLREAVERIADLGPAALTDVELIAILLGNADAAQRLCQAVNVRRLHEVRSARARHPVAGLEHAGQLVRDREHARLESALSGR